MPLEISQYLTGFTLIVQLEVAVTTEMYGDHPIEFEARATLVPGHRTCTGTVELWPTAGAVGRRGWIATRVADVLVSGYLGDGLTEPTVLNTPCDASLKTTVQIFDPHRPERIEDLARFFERWASALGRKVGRLVSVTYVQEPQIQLAFGHKQQPLKGFLADRMAAQEVPA